MKPDDPYDFDQRMRAMHRQGLAGISPQVLSRLREARYRATAATPARGPAGWLLAGGTVSAVMALVLALQLRPPESGPARTPALASAGQQFDPAERAREHAQIDSEIEGMLAALDENPDLYLWLAANDDSLPPPSEP